MDPRRTVPSLFKARMIFAVLLTAFYILSPFIWSKGVLVIVGFTGNFVLMLVIFLYIEAIYWSRLYRHRVNELVQPLVPN